MKLFLLTVTAALLNSQVSARSQSTSLGFGDGVSNAAAHITQAHSFRDVQANVGGFPSGIGGGSLSGLGPFPSDALSAGFGASPGLGHVPSIPGLPGSSLLPFSSEFGSPFSTAAGLSPFADIPSLDGSSFPSLAGVPTLNDPLASVGFNGLSGIPPLPSPFLAPELSAAFNPFSSSLPTPLAPFPSALGSPLFPPPGPASDLTPLHFLPPNAGVDPFSSGLGFSNPSQVFSPFA